MNRHVRQPGARLLSCRWMALLALGLLATCAARAHDPGLSALAVRARPDGWLATLTMARPDAELLVALDVNQDGRIDPAEFAGARATLERLVAGAVTLRVAGHDLRPSQVAAVLDPSEAVQVALAFSADPGQALRIRSAVPSLLARGHREYLSVHDSTGQLLECRMLEAADAALETSAFPPRQAQGGPASSSPAVRSAGGFITMGIEHIATGYDHLVFLVGLLLVGASFRAVLKIITSFTVAHSITLALATMDVIRVPSGVVEPLIAVSIFYVGIENLFHKNPERRWRLTFLFGLVHGCGFATALRDVGVGGGQPVAVPLLAFNLGVELGQLALAALVVPLLWALQRRPVFPARCVPAGSLVIALAGAYWFMARVLAAPGP